MAIKIPSEITKEIGDMDYHCWHCNSDKPEGTVWYTQIYRDAEGFCSDSCSRCEACAEKTDMVEEFNTEYNQRMIARDLDQEAQDYEDAILEQRREAKHRETQYRADAQRKHRKECAKARRGHWVNKINSAFSNALPLGVVSGG